MFTYRVGLPLWKVAARAGVRMAIRVEMAHDKEDNVFIARSSDLPGLFVEADTFDELLPEIQSSVDDLMNDILKSGVSARPNIHVRDLASV